MSTRAMLISAVFILATIAVRGAQTPSAKQAPAAKWTELQRHDLPDLGREGVEMSIEIPRGVITARHSHAGDDFGYVVEGAIMLMADGQPPLTVKAGETFYTKRGQVHNARNIGKTTAIAVDTYIIDKGKPF